MRISHVCNDLEIEMALTKKDISKKDAEQLFDRFMSAVKYPTDMKLTEQDLPNEVSV